MSSTCLLYSSHFLFIWPNSWFFFVSTNRVGLKQRCTLSLAVAHWKCTCAITPTRLGLSYKDSPWSEVCQTCRKHSASCLDLPMLSTASTPQNWCILEIYQRLFVGLDPVHHHVIFDIAVPVWYNVMLWLTFTFIRTLQIWQFGYFNVLFRTGWKYTSTVFVLY